MTFATNLETNMDFVNNFKDSISKSIYVVNHDFSSLNQSLNREFIFFGFRTGFRPTNGGRLIWLVRRGMRTGQALFPLGIEPGISRIRP